MKKKADKWPKHKMGVTYGYEEYEDGSIEIAPALADIIDSVKDQEDSIKSACEIFNTLIINLMKDVNRKKQEFWEKIRDEYGLDLTSHYVYNHGSRRVSVRKEK